MNLSPEERVLDAIFEKPTTGLSYREIERASNVSIGTVSKVIKILEKQSLVLLEKRPHAILVRGNTENETFRWRKRLGNLRNIYSSGIIDFLINEVRPHGIILFGSFAKGIDDEKSDVDICLVKGRNVRVDCKPFEKKLARPINIISLTEDNQAYDEFLANLTNGILLYGYWNVWDFRAPQGKKSN